MRLVSGLPKDRALSEAFVEATFRGGRFQL